MALCVTVSQGLVACEHQMLEMQASFVACMALQASW